MNPNEFFNQSVTPRHVCGQCGDEWLTEDEYLTHTCPKTNATPQDVAHFGDEFRLIQQAALERGLERIPETDADQIAQQEAAIAEVVDPNN